MQFCDCLLQHFENQRHFCCETLHEEVVLAGLSTDNAYTAAWLDD